MRIGLITGEYPPMRGGVGDFTALLAQALIAQGHMIEVFSTPPAQSQNGEVVNTAIRRWDFRSLPTVQRWAKANWLDVLNLQYQTAAYRMSPWIHVLPRWVKAAPTITTFHDLRFPYLFPKAGLLRERIVMSLAYRSAGVITTNHEDYAKVKHLPNSTMIPIGSTIRPDLPPQYDAQAWRAKMGVSPDTLLIGYFGFINHTKGVDTLLESFAALPRKRPVRLLMIGEHIGTSDPTNAGYAAQIKRQIENYGLTEEILWTGSVSDVDVNGWLRAVDLVVMPFRDGASYRRSSLMAAIQQGCAIVTTQPTVPILTFQHGENIWLIPSQNANALTQAFQSLSDPALRQRLQAGAAQLAHTFDPAARVQATLDFYTQVRQTWHR
jgi:glycosyltransferase involved in cell wall biosynthesis